MPTKMDSAKSAASSTKNHGRDLEIDEELDFSSPKFNPKRALFDPNVKVAFENIPTFSSLQAYKEAIENRQRARSGSNISISRSSQRDRDIEQSSSKGHGSRTESTPVCSAIGYKSRHAGQKQSHKSQEISVHQSIHAERKRIDKPSSSSIQEKLLEISKMPAIGQKVKSNPDYGIKEKVYKTEESESDSSRLSKGKETPCKKRNVFTRMEEMTGPLRLLTRCVEQKLHVRVMTRGAVLVRSICRGYIVAFDKHFNMALIDVDEIYRRPAILGKIRSRRSHKLKAAQSVLQEERKEQALQNQDEVTAYSSEEKAMSHQPSIKDTPQRLSYSGHSSCSKVKSGPKNPSVYDRSIFSVFQFEREALMLGIAEENVEHRHLNQILIRGENVVLVSIINE